MSTSAPGRRLLPPASSNTWNIAAACALGAGVSWNIANVGALAGPIADRFGIGLAAVGLFTTVLFLAELLAMVPAGRRIDRVGPWEIGMLALCFTLVGNALGLLVDDVVPALVLRAVAGIGVGAGFIAGATYVQSVGGSGFAQGIYGGVSLAGGGLAVAVVPALEGALGWQAPFVTGVAASVVGLVALGFAARPGGSGATADAPYLRLLVDRRLLRFAAMHASAFALAIVLSNWVVTVLERRGGVGTEAAGAVGALILVMGVLGRPLGGFLTHRRPEATRRLMYGGIAAGALGTLLIGLADPIVLPVLGTLLVGLAAGLPFAAVVGGIARIYPKAPGAAFGAANSYAQLTIIVGTPLVGLGFSLPGDGLIGFAAVAALWAAAAAAVPSRELLGQPATG